ncbi:acyltransferase family protein [Acinetobacter sp.]|uniref:acyltransferase family protein n=1 Tax=Acinetobacter sp. TaxID=472 RepID=UPI00388DE7A5
MLLDKAARQNELDLLRVIAALSVFIFHYTDSFNYVNNIVPGNFGIGVFFRYGYMGVPLFFVISGYVVTMTAMNKSFTEFVISRISRLYPVFWLSCIIAFMLPRVIPHVPTYLP